MSLFIFTISAITSIVWAIKKLKNVLMNEKKNNEIYL